MFFLWEFLVSEFCVRKLIEFFHVWVEVIQNCVMFICIYPGEIIINIVSYPTHNNITCVLRLFIDTSYIYVEMSHICLHNETKLGYQLRMELKQSQCSGTPLPHHTTIFSKYSPQTSQIQVVEEGLSRTCIGVSPQRPLTL